METWQSRKDWHDIFRVLNKKKEKEEEEEEEEEKKKEREGQKVFWSKL